jgi:hypothetical protein
MASLNNLEGKITSRHKTIFNIQHPVAPIWVACVSKTIGIEKNLSTYTVLECFVHNNTTTQWSNGVISFNRGLFNEIAKTLFQNKFEVIDFDAFKFHWKHAFNDDKSAVYELLVEVDLTFIYKHLI